MGRTVACLICIFFINMLRNSSNISSGVSYFKRTGHFIITSFIQLCWSHVCKHTIIHKLCLSCLLLGCFGLHFMLQTTKNKLSINLQPSFISCLCIRKKNVNAWFIVGSKTSPFLLVCTFILCGQTVFSTCRLLCHAVLEILSNPWFSSILFWSLECFLPILSAGFNQCFYTFILSQNNAVPGTDFLYFPVQFSSVQAVNQFQQCCAQSRLSSQETAFFSE